MEQKEALLFVIVLIVVGLIYSGNFWNTVVWGAVIWCVIVIIRKYRNKPRIASYESQTIQVGNFDGVDGFQTDQDPAELNSEKHGCKCYMEKLTDGEREIAHVLSEGLNYKDYYIFNNLTIPSQHNGSSQIDHLVISRYGIFVIESKDYSGWIFGSRDNEHWTQTFPNGEKHPFQNPLHQNWSHIMSLRSLFSFLPENVFRNIVVFSESSEFKSEQIENVVSVEQIIDTIRSNTEYLLTEDNVQFVIGKLSYLCQTADISHEQHLENISLHQSKL
jgi:hypothetical protein